MAPSAVKRSPICVVGAMSYDQIAQTEQPFLQNGPALNCKLINLTRHFGGCGGNIAFGITQLGPPPLLLSALGQIDAAAYQQHCAEHGIDQTGVLMFDEAHCARAMVFSDPLEQQFTAFFPGPVPVIADWQKHLASVQQDLQTARVMLCAPYPEALMRESLRTLRQMNPQALRLWCPGQYADRLDTYAMTEFAGEWEWLIGNEHEIKHLRQISGSELDTKTLIETRGGEPVRVQFTDGDVRQFNVAEQPMVADPTGCGDAFAAGFSQSIAQALSPTESPAALPLEKTKALISLAVQQGIRLASACLRHTGCQSYQIDRNAL